MRGLAFIAAVAAATQAGVALAQPALPGPLGALGGRDWIDGDTPRAEAWAAARTADALRALYADARYAPFRDQALGVLEAAAAPEALELRYGEVFALHRSHARPRGLWRRATLASYRAGAPGWETLLDLDALAAAEKRPWTFTGADCSPTGLKCMIRLSRGGRRANAAREFDMEAKAFPEGGFALPEGVRSLAWLDEDRLAVAASWPAGRNAAVLAVRTLERGGPPAGGATLYAAAADAQGLTLRMLVDVDGARRLLAEETGRDGARAWTLLDEKGAVRLTAPPFATLETVHKGELVFRVARDWAPDWAPAPFRAGGLYSFPIDKAREGAPYRQVALPQAGERFEGLGSTQAALLAERRRAGRVELVRLSFDGRAWFESAPAPAAAERVTIAAASAEDAEAIVRAEGPSRPPALSAFGPRDRTPEAQAPAPDLETTRFEAASAAGQPVGYRLTRKAGAAPRAVLIRLGSPDAHDAVAAKLWIEQGGALAEPDETTPAAVEAVAADLAARGLATPRRIGLSAAGAHAAAAAAAAAARGDLFTAVVLEEPTLDARALAWTPAAPATLVFANDAGGPGPARRLVDRIERAGGRVNYVETDEGGGPGAPQAAPIDQARRAALAYVFLQSRLID